MLIEFNKKVWMLKHHTINGNNVNPKAPFLKSVAKFLALYGKNL